MPLCDGTVQELDIVAQVRRTQPGDSNGGHRRPSTGTAACGNGVLHGYTSRRCRAIVLASCTGQPGGHAGTHSELEAGTGGAAEAQELYTFARPLTWVL
jgi:hypothetical protein